MKTRLTFRTMFAALALFLSVQGEALSQSVQFGSFTSGSSFYINAKSSVDFPSNYLCGVVFAVRWLNSYGVSLGAVTTSYGMAKAGSEIVSGAYRYQKFYQQNVPLSLSWSANAEYQLLSIPVNQTGQGTGIFELAPVGSIADGDPYIEIDFSPEINAGDPFYQSTTTVTLPVELASFTVKPDGTGVMLAWKTATETNNAGFDVERSALAPEPSARQWAAVGFVEGGGTSNAPKDYTFRNKNVPTGKYVYRLKQMDRDGKFKYSAEVEATVAAPGRFALSQNYPNPFNPSTTITFAAAEDSRVSVKVYDLAGREVASLLEGEVAAGYYALPFDGRSLASGVYLYRMTAAHGGSVYSETKRLVLLK